MKKVYLFFSFLLLCLASNAQVGSWETEATSDGSSCAAKNEANYVKSEGKFYYLGGRGNQLIDEYNPKTKTWVTKTTKTRNLHHFQAVDFDGDIYIVCAFTDGFPTETPVSNIFIYDPESDEMTTGDEIPENRRRGSAGTVVYNDKIYVVGGITNGHTDGHVAWFDEYDPATGQWRALPDAPHARDHFNAVVYEDKLYVVSGRKSIYEDGVFYMEMVPEVDVYDFRRGSWTTLDHNIPTERAGAATVAIGNRVIVMGGESMSQYEAHNEVEALNVATEEWETFPSLETGRHGTQAVVYNNQVYIAGGSGVKGSGDLRTDQEVFTFVTLSNNKANNSASMSFYPNPCKDFLTVKVEESGSFTLDIYDFTGRKVKEQELSKTTNLNIKSLPAGMYVGKITTKSGKSKTFNFYKK